MQSWEEFKQEQFHKKPDLKREYDALQPQYDLAVQIIEARLKKGLNQAQLAAKMGTKQSAVARLESGSYNPSLRILERVAKATGAQLEIKLVSKVPSSH